MSSEPPRKRFKQQTINSMFASTKSKDCVIRMEDDTTASPAAATTTQDTSQQPHASTSIHHASTPSTSIHHTSTPSTSTMESTTDGRREGGEQIMGMVTESTDIDRNEDEGKNDSKSHLESTQSNNPTKEECSDTESKKNVPESNERKAKPGKEDKDTKNEEKKGHASTSGSPHKKKKNGDRNGSDKNGGERDVAESHPRSDHSKKPATSPKEKYAKGSTPKKTFKKATPEKGHRRSPGKDGSNKKAYEEASQRRRLMAAAAERRQRDTPSPPPRSPLQPALEDNETGATWRGSPLASLPFLSPSNVNVPPVFEAPDHALLVQYPLRPDAAPSPYPATYQDTWDQFHVRMPCSPKSLYPTNKGEDLVPRWSVICKALSRKMESVADLQAAILEYNSRYAAKWRFRGLQALLEEEFEEEEQELFFQKTLPAMAQLALSLPKVLTQAPPLLTQHATYTVTMSQLQVASLLANAFFCTFPRRNAKGSDTEYASYPDINFNRLFFHNQNNSIEKLKCILNYFRRVTTKEPSGVVTFSRQYVAPASLPAWETSAKPLPRLHLDTQGLIEDQIGFLQVDFANKFIGGGVLGLGCVQEEIRFVLCPELLVSRLFTQVLDKTEALVVIGAEQFNKGVGYASNFRWDGSHKDATPRDPWGRRMCQVTAIDALHFTKQPAVQYRQGFITRELNKAYAGYRVLEGSAGTPAAVATGNWGCGAFRGDPRLKSLLQLAVCGHLGRDVAYFTFGDRKLRNEMSSLHIFLKENNVTVGELVQVLNQHGARGSDGSDFLHYIYHSFGRYDSDTDVEDGGSIAEGKNKPDNLNQHKDASPDSGPSKTDKTIRDFFKKTSSRHDPSTNLNEKPKHPKAPAGGKTEDNLTEEKILQVLSECDRLVEDQKGKGCEAKGGANKAKDELILEKKHKGQLAASTSEPSRLFHYLDEIDKGLAT